MPDDLTPTQSRVLDYIATHSNGSPKATYRKGVKA